MLPALTCLSLPEVKAAVQVPTVGLTPNPDLEQIVAMKPDLVLLVK